MHSVHSRGEIAIRRDAFGALLGAVLRRVARADFGEVGEIQYGHGQDDVERQQAVEGPAVNRSHYKFSLIQIATAFHAMVVPTTTPTSHTTRRLVVFSH